MKKYIAGMICIAFIIAICTALGACGKTQVQTTAAPEQTSATDAPALTLQGGWQKAASPVITQEIRAVVEKATAELTGATYTPVAYIASQVVAGTNHLVLCKTAPVVPDAQESYVLVTIYEDLQGNSQITDVYESGYQAASGTVDGGWGIAESPVVDDALQAAFAKANSVLAGGQYTPLALLETQVVAGTNYCVLCEMTATVPDATAQYCIVILNEDLAGSVEILETIDFSAAE